MADRFQALYLGSIFKNKENPPCCPLIIFEDTPTIHFLGLGTPANPFTANAIVSSDAGNGLSIRDNGLYSSDGAGGAPAGGNNDIQFNEEGAFTADPGAFIYDPTNGSTFRTPLFQADINGLLWGDSTGNVFASGVTGFQYSNINGDHFTINSLNLLYNNGGTDVLHIGSSTFHYTNTVSVITISGDSFNYNNPIDTLSVSGGDFNYNSDTDSFRAGHLSFNYTSGPNHFTIGGSNLNYTNGTDHIAIGGTALNYGNGSDIFNISSGLGYANTTNGEGFSISIGLNYTNTAGANFQIGTNGQVSINLASGSPTGFLDICAGVNTAGGAPIKLHAGTLLTAPEAGAFEFDGTHLYFTIGVTRTILI